ncbi:MAG: hypothetical protein Q9Q40_00635 [Acidobacteriota bacterium]|nr:hypothetical protein [Acidobacteriota bacterium]
MGQTIGQGHSQPSALEHWGPIEKRQIGIDDHTALFMVRAEGLKRQIGGPFGERQIAQFVDHQKIERPQAFDGRVQWGLLLSLFQQAGPFYCHAPTGFDDRPPRPDRCRHGSCPSRYRPGP